MIGVGRRSPLGWVAGPAATWRKLSLLAALLGPHMRALASCQAVMLPFPWNFATHRALYQFASRVTQPTDEKQDPDRRRQL
jgi:hypothetical protein